MYCTLIHETKSLELETYYTCWQSEVCGLNVLLNIVRNQIKIDNARKAEAVYSEGGKKHSACGEQIIQQKITKVALIYAAVLDVLFEIWEEGGQQIPALHQVLKSREMVDFFSRRDARIHQLPAEDRSLCSLAFSSTHAIQQFWDEYDDGQLKHPLLQALSKEIFPSQKGRKLMLNINIKRTDFLRALGQFGK